MLKVLRRRSNTSKLDRAVAILRNCGIRNAEEFGIVIDSQWHLGDCAVLLNKERQCIEITFLEGPWMRGPNHKPGGDYRSATDEEWDSFSKGLHLRRLPKTRECPCCKGKGVVNA